MSTTRRGRKTKDERKREQFELVKQWRREWIARTRPTDRFSLTPDEKEDQDARQDS